MKTQLSNDEAKVEKAAKAIYAAIGNEIESWANKRESFVAMARAGLVAAGVVELVAPPTPGEKIYEAWDGEISQNIIEAIDENLRGIFERVRNIIRRRWSEGNTLDSITGLENELGL